MPIKIGDLPFIEEIKTTKVTVSTSTRDALKAKKSGLDSYNDVIRRLLGLGIEWGYCPDTCQTKTSTKLSHPARYDKLEGVTKASAP